MPSAVALRPLAQAAWLSVALTGFTAAVIGVPELRVAVDAPGLRIALETAGVAALSSAALLLALLARDGNAPRRHAFVAALTVQAGVNTVFGVVPNLLGVPDTTLASTFYPWLAARYVSGLLFLLAALPAMRSRIPTRVLVAGTLAAIAAVEIGVVLNANVLPVPPPLGRTPVIALEPGHLLLECVPLVLFGVGAYLAGRSYVRTGAPVERWLSLALLTGVFVQFHEALFPAALGRIVTSADILRAASTVLLAAGAVAQVRRLVADRSRALGLLQADLGRSQDLVAALHAAADREEAFHSIVAHELASPVAAIGAYAHLLAPTNDGPSMMAVHALREEAERLGALVRRVNELRQLDDPGFTVELRPVAIRPLLEEVAQFARGLPGGHPVIVDAAEARVQADAVRLGQVLRNLLSNAVRYSSDATPVNVVGRLCADGSHGYSVTVVDCGPGIGTDDVEPLFSPYERGAAAAGAAGTGLGLHIARRIVHAHGGDISFIDPVQPGARVRLELGLAT